MINLTEQNNNDKKKICLWSLTAIAAGHRTSQLCWIKLNELASTQSGCTKPSLTRSCPLEVTSMSTPNALKRFIHPATAIDVSNQGGVVLPARTTDDQPVELQSGCFLQDLPCCPQIS